MANLAEVLKLKIKSDNLRDRRDLETRLRVLHEEVSHDDSPTAKIFFDLLEKGLRAIEARPQDDELLKKVVEFTELFMPTEEKQLIQGLAEIDVFLEELERLESYAQAEAKQPASAGIKRQNKTDENRQWLDQKICELLTEATKQEKNKAWERFDFIGLQLADLPQFKEADWLVQQRNTQGNEKLSWRDATSEATAKDKLKFQFQKNFRQLCYRAFEKYQTDI